MDIDFHRDSLNAVGHTKITEFLSSEELLFCTNLTGFLSKSCIAQFKHDKRIKKSLQYKHPDQELWSYHSGDTFADIRIKEGTHYLNRMQHVFNNNHITNKAINLIHSLVGSDLKYFKDRYIEQHPGEEGLLPHQDMCASVHEKVFDSWYTIYIALTDTNEQSGSLFVEEHAKLKKENLGMCVTGCDSLRFTGVASSCACNGKRQGVALENIYSYNHKHIAGKKHTMIPIPLKAGDCIIFDGWLLHGTPINESESVRKVLTFAYVKPKANVDVQALASTATVRPGMLRVFE
tara:strand:+ start:2681 stop:3553 length:873 start_codon:yes stop_codon:yes gene_type:complete